MVEQKVAALLSPVRPLCCNHYPHAHRDRYPAVNSPLHLPGHETTGQNVDALKEPDSTDQDEENAENVQDESHIQAPFVKQIVPPENPPVTHCFYGI
jgi:hypothetical protein